VEIHFLEALKRKMFAHPLLKYLMNISFPLSSFSYINIYIYIVYILYKNINGHCAQLFEVLFECREMSIV